MVSDICKENERDAIYAMQEEVVLYLAVQELLSRVKLSRHESTMQVPATQETLFAPVMRVQSYLRIQKNPL
jgi:hypothetical protein